MYEQDTEHRSSRRRYIEGGFFSGLFGKDPGIWKRLHHRGFKMDRLLLKAAFWAMKFSSKGIFYDPGHGSGILGRGGLHGRGSDLLGTN